jgi:hypothetical protein
VRKEKILKKREEYAGRLKQLCDIMEQQHEEKEKNEHKEEKVYRYH